jgi:lysozyme
MRKTLPKKTSVRRKAVKKNTKRKKKSFFSKYKVEVFIFIMMMMVLMGVLVKFRKTIMYYCDSERNNISKAEIIANNRHQQILNKHKGKVFGFDVSQFQGDINWHTVDFLEGKYPLNFVFIRATAGNNKVDKCFYKNWESAKKHQIIRGAYHYYRPDENSTDQASHFINNVALEKGDLPPVLDIEQMPKKQSMTEMKKGLRNWLEMVDKHYNVKPIIYTGSSYYEDFLKKEFKEYPFWIANYNHHVKEIKEDWMFWQFTEKAELKGVQYKVDINIYNGTPKMLEYLTISN